MKSFETMGLSYQNEIWIASTIKEINIEQHTTRCIVSPPDLANALLNLKIFLKDPTS